MDVPLRLGALGAARSFAWAPDGRAVTVARTTEGASNVWRHPLDGAPPTRLTSYPPGDDIALHAWSRDGKFLALVRDVSQRGVVMLREAGASPQTGR